MARIIVALMGVAVFGCGQSTAPPAKPPMPAVSSTASSITEAQLGLPFYPGAQTGSGSQEGKRMSVDLTTTDSPDKVAAFYAQQLGGNPETKKELTTVSGKKGDGQFTVAISTEQGKTKIWIMGEKK